MIRSLLATACTLLLATGLRAQTAGAVKEIILHPDNANPLAYDAPSMAFTVKAGEKVKVTLENKALVPMPHNVCILKPGTMQKVGMLANASMTDPTFISEKHCIPESTDILWHTKLVQPGQSESIEFVAPEPGEYPYICTFPGHWLIMKGVMKVEK
jgi:azurin